VIGIEVQTDHQPLSFAISDKNPNINPKVIYKPGTTNVVADALSRIQINTLIDTNESVSDQNTQHSAESSFENVIQETQKP